MTRQEAIASGNKCYIGTTPCKRCGGFERYVSSYSCKTCIVVAGKAKLANTELMASYRTKEKRAAWASKNPDKVAATKKRYKVKHRGEYYAANRDKWRAGQLRKDYGITLEEYDSMLHNQGGKCAICQTTECSSGKNMAVDHNHDTGKIRGILCMQCNRSLGGFKDDISLLKDAIRYLENNQ